MQAKKFSVILSLTSMLFFISCRSSLSACIDFSSQANTKIDNTSHSVSLPTCHQTSNERSNPDDPSDSKQKNQANPTECKCAISYSEPLQYGETSHTKISLDLIHSFSDQILKINLEKQISLSFTKQAEIRSSYFNSLNTIRLLI